MTYTITSPNGKIDRRKMILKNKRIGLDNARKTIKQFEEKAVETIY
jgi:hypothetical protein